MSDDPSDEQQPTLVKSHGLPPMFGPIVSGKRTWVRVEEIDHELMGYLLSCHLMIEHYMNAFLKAHHDGLDWDAAKLTFGQQVTLLTKWDIGPQFNPVSTVKHLNTLRNRLGHRVDYALTQEDMLPFVYYLERACEQPLEDKSPKAVLSLFTTICAAVFGGSVARADEAKGKVHWPAAEPRQSEGAANDDGDQP